MNLCIGSMSFGLNEETLILVGTVILIVAAVVVLVRKPKK